jgi:hypothetical protein
MNDPVAPDVKQARVSNFMKVLPLTLAVAGLGQAAPNTLYTPDQMEARAMNIRMAYKLARALLREVGEQEV